jgi:hypothetical protein
MVGNALSRAVRIAGNPPGRREAGAKRIAMLLMTAIVVAVAGCGPSEKIEQYQVDKPETLAEKYFPVAAGDRMLAAIVPHGSQLWFFKFAGPDKAVRKQAEEFGQFLISLHFAAQADSPPEWTLPEGWIRQPGNQFRYATLEIDPGPPRLEVSVSMLMKPEGDAAGADAVLQNVNRWRSQMSLSPITVDHLADSTKRVDLAGEPSIFVDLTGKLGSGGMPAPFAGGAMPPGHPELPSGRAELPPDHSAIPSDGGDKSERPSAEVSAELTFDTPAGWQPGEPNAMSMAAFVVEDGSRKVVITATPLSPIPDYLLANVNRWREQVGLPKTTAEELTKQIKPISVDGAKGGYVELVGPATPAPQRTIIGAIVEVGSRLWFIKLSGDAQLAEREKPKFEAFLKSIKFAAK